MIAAATTRYPARMRPRLRRIVLGLAAGVLAAKAAQAVTLPEYPGADVFTVDCTNKCAAGRNGTAVDLVVIEDTESDWDAAVATLQNDPGKSVHYIVGADGRVGQFVAEEDTAFHAGNLTVNRRSIGVTHVGHRTTGDYTAAGYTASAQLVAYLLAKYGIPADRSHVVGLDQVPNPNLVPEDAALCSDSPAACEQSDDYGGAGNHRDPGVLWDWCGYLQRLGGTCKCSDATATLTCSADSSMAYRCVGGQVEVDACDGPGGCVPGAGAADAVCNQVAVDPCAALAPAPRAKCLVDALVGMPLCESEPIFPTLASTAAHRLGLADGLLGKVVAGGKPKTVRRLLRRADRALAALPAKTAHAAAKGKVSAACATHVAAAIAPARAAIAAVPR